MYKVVYFSDMTMQKYIDKLQQSGTLYFSIDDLLSVFEASRQNLYNRLNRFVKRGAIFSPLKGFYVIIPQEHRSLGSLPAEELVVITMRHLGIPYYAGLLTAARYHGATHQGLFAFHVVTSKRMPKEWVVGQERIRFIYKKDICAVETTRKTVDTGELLVSTPEETAKDVMIYYRQCGGLNHQATVLSELTEAIDTDKLVSLAERSGGLFWVQRMGYILEKIDTFYEKDRDRVVGALEKFLENKKLRYIPLSPEITTKNKPRNKKWHIIVTATVEADF